MTKRAGGSYIIRKPVAAAAVAETPAAAAAAAAPRVVLQIITTRAMTIVSLTENVACAKVTATVTTIAKEILFASNVAREIPFLVAMAPQVRVSKRLLHLSYNDIRSLTLLSSIFRF